MRLLSEYSQLEVTWVVLGATSMRKDEAITSADKFTAGAARQQIVTESFKDGYFPYIGAEIKDYFEALKKSASSPKHDFYPLPS